MKNKRNYYLATKTKFERGYTYKEKNIMQYFNGRRKFFFFCNFVVCYTEQANTWNNENFRTKKYKVP